MKRWARYAMHKESLDAFLRLQKEVAEAKRGMSAADMREAIEDIYAEAQIYQTPGADESVQLYSVNESGEAHIPVVGVLTPQINPCAALFGDAETEYGFISAAVEQAEKDYRVKSIALDIDSPGGYVDGVDSAAAAVANAGKPTTSYVHNMAASAAYWIASQTDKIIAVGPTTVVGSIGVAATFIDYTEMDKMAGIKEMTFTSTEAPDKRLDLTKKEDQQKFIAELDEIHNVFASKVASGRGTTIENVNENFGRGGTVIASRAVELGMIDSVVDYSASEREVITQERPGVAGDNKPASEAADKGVPMDKVQLKNENPALYEEIFNEGKEAGKDEGVKAEQQRRSALDKMAAVDPDNKQLQEVVAKAKEEGVNANDPAFQASVNVAIRDGKKLEGENAPDVETEEADKGQGEDYVKATVSRLAKIGG